MNHRDINYGRLMDAKPFGAGECLRNDLIGLLQGYKQIDWNVEEVATGKWRYERISRISKQIQPSKKRKPQTPHYTRIDCLPVIKRADAIL
ncbi:hypothetical protein Bealeia1_02050 (plasmid) [Candidatus Bealeia paramacronuclearis]|uniref:Uncharacterized protein n=1 Tax=Candidatus Bealeia paramacronuclearis TaxID=1921001 RepID=A0ABZ2C938_9PROT